MEDNKDLVENKTEEIIFDDKRREAEFDRYQIMFQEKVDSLTNYDEAKSSIIFEYGVVALIMFVCSTLSLFPLSKIAEFIFSLLMQASTSIAMALPMKAISNLILKYKHEKQISEIANLILLLGQNDSELSDSERIERRFKIVQLKNSINLSEYSHAKTEIACNMGFFFLMFLAGHILSHTLFPANILFDIAFIGALEIFDIASLIKKFGNRGRITKKINKILAKKLEEIKNSDNPNMEDLVKLEELVDKVSLGEKVSKSELNEICRKKVKQK